MGDPRAGHEALEQCLGITRASHFLAIAQVGDLFDSGKTLKGLDSQVGFQANGVEAVDRLNFVQGAVEYFLSLVRS